LILKEYKIYAMFAAAEKLYSKSISNKQLLLGTGVAVGIEIVRNFTEISCLNKRLFWSFGRGSARH
jgi:hypothetical protein